MLSTPAVHQHLRGFVLPSSLLVRDTNHDRSRRSELQQLTGLPHVPGQARWLHVTIMAIVLDEQGSVGCFQHTVSCQIRRQLARTPLLAFLHRKITEGFGNGHAGKGAPPQPCSPTSPEVDPSATRAAERRPTAQLREEGTAARGGRQHEAALAGMETSCCSKRKLCHGGLVEPKFGLFCTPVRHHLRGAQQLPSNCGHAPSQKLK